MDENKVVQTIGAQPTPKEALKEIVNEGMNHFAEEPQIKQESSLMMETVQVNANDKLHESMQKAEEAVSEMAVLPESTPHDIDGAVDKYVGEAQSNAEELKSLYTEQGAADALYKQVSSATNMMMDASKELTEKVIDEQMALIQKVIDDEKAKGELADANAISQAESILETVTKFKDEEFMKITILKDADEKAQDLYAYLRAQLTDKKKLIRLYRTPPTDTQIIRVCEDMCRIFGVLVPLKGANAVVGIDTTVTAALSNALNRPKTYGLSDLARYVYSEEVTKNNRGAVLSKAIRFVVRFMAEHTRHFLAKNKTPEERKLYQFIAVEDAITAITYDEALNPTNKATPTTEGFTQLVAELFKVYFTDIKVNSLK